MTSTPATRTTRRVIAAALACVLIGANSADASELTEGIRDLLNDVDRQVEDARIWKLRIRPSFSQSVISTDNVFLNDRDEQPFRLTRVVTANGQITDPARLARIQRNLPDFQAVESVGRVGDTISRTQLRVGLVLPVNPEITKLVDVKELNVLTLRLRRHEYFDRNELDNGDFSLSTDVAAFLGDILDFSAGNRFWVRASADHSRVEEPLDTNIVELQQVGIRSVDFKNFERTTSAVRLNVGYDENHLDVTVGGELYRMRLRDRELRQAEYDRTTLHTEAGYDLPWFQDKRIYVRGEVEFARPGDRAVDGDTQALNDGDRHRAVVGIDGAFFSKKVTGRLEAGYRSWHPDVDSGASGDRARAHGLAAGAKLAYQPFEGRRTRLQFSYTRSNEVSAISNFNDVHRGTVSLLHPVIERTLDADLSFGFTRTDASEGPSTRRYDVGFGLVYHAFEQVDVSLRYTYRRNDSRDEIRIQSSFARGGRQYVFVSESNGDFEQNVVELGVNVRF